MDKETADRKCALAFALAVGMDVGKDPVAAVEIFREVASEGYPNGQFGLAELLIHGEGIEKNEPEAVGLYTLAAEQGHPEALYRLGTIIADSDPENAETYLKESASLGVSAALSALGNLYFENDPAKALGWYVLASEAGDPAAAFMAGYMYEEGIGTEKNMETATELFGYAAKAGLPEAELRYAHLVDEGTAPGDRKDCFLWYSLAAEHGMVSAKFNLASMYSEGDGVGKDEHKAFLLTKEAADETQDSTALYVVGAMYLEGLGTEKDTEKAMGYLRKAADGGHEGAAQVLDILRRGQNTQFVTIDGTE
ncbi:MAG: sel1 repeat family protein [Candidatus Methanoplasma sp.]|jgi:TPR repeat protein|nr:sel1 repeat family protein [Candidatus Methanoplasma sp.]